MFVECKKVNQLVCQWWHIPFIPPLGRQRQVDLCESKAIPGEQQAPGQLRIHGENLSQNKQNKNLSGSHFPRDTGLRNINVYQQAIPCNIISYIWSRQSREDHRTAGSLEQLFWLGLLSIAQCFPSSLPEHPNPGPSLPSSQSS